MNEFVEDMQEIVRATDEKYRPVGGLHEAYALILEEVDELWDIVRQKEERRSKVELRAELLQIAAMCHRAARGLGVECRQPRTAVEVPHA